MLMSGSSSTTFTFLLRCCNRLLRGEKPVAFRGSKDGRTLQGARSLPRREPGSSGEAYLPYAVTLQDDLPALRASRQAGCNAADGRHASPGLGEDPLDGLPGMPSEGESCALRCRFLVKHYGNVVAVDGLDLEVRVGECFGLLGPNGAGKTTTLEMIEGINFPDSGDIEVFGCAWTRGNDCALRERLGIQLQEARFAEKLTVEETLCLFRSFYRQGHKVDDIIRTVALTEKRNTRVGKLSSGQKQRLALACSLVGDPDLLFLERISQF